MAASLRASVKRLCPLDLVFKSTSKKTILQLNPSALYSRNAEQSLFVVPYQGRTSRSYATSSVLRAGPASASPTDSTASSAAIAPEWKTPENVYSEHHIPITHQSIIRHLVEEKGLLTEEERNLFPEFVRALDTALVNRYHGILEEMKMLFDPCNPDKETATSRQWTRKEKLDSEFYLLQLLGDVMATANFQELPAIKLERFLRDHATREKVRVSVDPSRYDVLRFWVLGHEVPKFQLSILERVLKRLLPKSSKKPVEYYKRVVVALRLKKDSKLTLKAFKEVPVDNIEKLLPDGKIQMRSIDRGVLATTAAVTGLGILAKLGAYLASVNIDWTLVVTLLAGAYGIRVWSTYTDRKNEYLIDAARLLYFKNIGNNKSLLTLLADRAQDESLKEALLAYVFLLNSQPHDLRNKIQSLFVTLAPGGLTGEELAVTVEKWLEKKTGAVIKFDSAEAVKVLKSLGLLIEQDNKYHAVQLNETTGLLPHCPRSVVGRRSTEADLTEGYDRDEHLESAVFYKAEEHKARRYGWF